MGAQERVFVGGVSKTWKQVWKERLKGEELGRPWGWLHQETDFLPDRSGPVL